ncbi:TraB/GumN family protein [Kordiimonas sp. SCSIO 12603]|uniref:TraB/GumN family protein n=1 Tax=Kordiimonas sp. SCSIO 12603 TaxID=2829596 RepID=UPI002107841E|nr:TraB/GumN family protein [Kordiimonas sp. SCSIO 12603]UTW58826.1 TraB/GumN family protein [Kordiimonas sp. SCSIO 12603]
MLKHILALALLTIPSFANGPAVWKTADEDTNIHILGSVHVLKPGTVWMNDNLQSLVSGADKIYLELSAKDQSPQVMQPLVVKYGLLPEGDALKNHLPEDVYSKLKTALTGLGMQEPQFARFKPWMAGTIYTAFKFAKLGFNPAAGVEASIVSLAQAKGLEIDGLETAEFQLSMFDNMTDEQEVNFLKQMFADEDDLQQTMETITSAWTTGDLKAMETVFDKSFDEYPELEQSILLDRNKNWVPQIEAILEQPGDYMIIVGTGHLVGEGSVIDLLKQKGMQVERVQ